MTWQRYLWWKITANNRSHFTFHTGETRSWKNISEASQWFCDDKKGIFVNATKPWMQCHAPSVCFKFSAFCICKIKRVYNMSVCYSTPLHNDLVTNSFNAASAELEFKGHFLEIQNILKPQQRKWYSIKSACCAGLIKNLCWVIDTRMVINPWKTDVLVILLSSSLVHAVEKEWHFTNISQPNLMQLHTVTGVLNCLSKSHLQFTGHKPQVM